MAIPRYRMRGLFAQLMAYCVMCADSIFAVLRATVETFEPTVEYALKEINATGHAQKVDSGKIVALPSKLSRNSATKHVSMLTALNGEALAA